MKIWIYPAAIVFALVLLVFFVLGLHRKPRWIRNFEEKEYGRERPFLEPSAVVDGLALYRVGAGEPVLLFFYPHGHTTEPMAQSVLAEILVEMGRTVIGFDVPGAYSSTREPEFWRIVVWGMRLNGGRGSLALHKRPQNLMEGATYHDAGYFVPVEIDADDFDKGVPIRTIWTQNMYNRLSYAHKLGEVKAPTLIVAGRQDPEAPLSCSRELLEGIEDARLVVFEHSGHAPFIEERTLFADTLREFLSPALKRPSNGE